MLLLILKQLITHITHHLSSGC